MVGLLTTPLPTDPQASQTMSLLGAAPLMPVPLPPKPPQMPVDPMTATNAWAAGMDNNAYGADLAKSALAYNAGFPSFQDPRLIQDHLAQLASGAITAPGVSAQAAQDEFFRQLQMANRNYGGGGWGGYGGGEGETGAGGGGEHGTGSGGHGQDASGQW